jgi:hypothetical protein
VEINSLVINMRGEDILPLAKIFIGGTMGALKPPVSGKKISNIKKPLHIKPNLAIMAENMGRTIKEIDDRGIDRIYARIIKLRIS